MGRFGAGGQEAWRGSDRGQLIPPQAAGEGAAAHVDDVDEGGAEPVEGVAGLQDATRGAERVLEQGDGGVRGGGGGGGGEGTFSRRGSVGDIGWIVKLHSLKKVTI